MAAKKYTGFSAFWRTLRYAWSREGRTPITVSDLEEEGSYEWLRDLRWKPWTWPSAFKGVLVVDD
jgi:hypothetical protein